jgi:hypothetical protein
MEVIGKFFVTMIMGLFSVIGRGFVIMKLWGWFIVSTFALNAISLVQAIGISLVVGLLTATLKYDENSEDDWFMKVFTQFIFVMLAYAVLLFEGWLVHLFM